MRFNEAGDIFASLYFNLVHHIMSRKILLLPRALLAAVRIS